MRRLILVTAGVLALTLVLSACGGGAATPTPTPRPTPTPTAQATPTPTKPVSGGDQLSLGLEVFKSGASPACTACHAIKGVSTANIGPDLSGIGGLAATAKPGMSAEAFIRESIVQPSAFITPGYPPIMPPDIAKGMSQPNLDALVAYLLSLK
ncbi:MAG: cytochrome c [Chloroflexota bacterium]|nr:cytochrome c [Chloroflexota bacterium]